MAQRVGAYELTRRIGSGGFADVWEARDANGNEVALKWLREAPPAGAAREVRERSALAMLEVPGVVGLLGHGTEQGRPYVVMELIRGKPFPAGRTEWTTLQDTVRALLTTLGHVHGAGLVHRDLKPANVLVEASGRPVILDFGLVRGTVLGPRITGTGAVLGTPAYLSPEQLGGDPCDGRADLYAVGVMIFEALSGHLPHTFVDLSTLWVARLTKPAPALDVPGVPEPVRELVRVLLARDPRNRPDDAHAALRFLDEGPSSATLPWVGPTAGVDAALQAIESGRSLEIVGPPGAGKSRHLAVIRDTLTGSRPVVELTPSQTPFGSVPDTWLEDGPDGVVGHASRHVRGGGVILVDAPETLDRWTNQLLPTLVAAGSVVSTRTSHVDATLDRLQASDLAALFVGPERVFRVPSDAAAELWRRTGGNPRRVDRELRSWVSQGLTQRRGERFEITRDAVDHLAASPAAAVPSGAGPALEPGLQLHLDWTGWLGELGTAERVARVLDYEPWRAELERATLVELGWIDENHAFVRVNAPPGVSATWTEAQREDAHRRACAVLPRGSRSRLHHAVDAGDPTLLAEALSEHLLDRIDAGAHNQGLTTLARLTRAGVIGERRLELTTLAVLMATSLGTASDAATALEVHERLGLGLGLGPGAEAPRRILAALVMVAENQQASALQQVTALGELTDLRLEACRLAVLVRAAVEKRDPARLSLAETLSPDRFPDEPGWMRAKRYTWLGTLHFTRGRAAQALGQHREALALRTERSGRISSLLNVSLCALWDGRLDEASQAAEEALQLAIEIRHFGYAGLAEFRLRGVAHRAGGTVPDLELCEALPDHADVWWTEAIIACRGGHPAAEDLARRARTLGEARGLRAQVAYCDAMLAYVGAQGWNQVDASSLTSEMRLDVIAMRDGAPVGAPPLVGVLR